MANWLGVLFCSLISNFSVGQAQMKLYLIPGQGSDERIFSKIQFSSNYEVHHVKYLVPDKGETMASYAKRLSTQIDTSQKFCLVGVSLGGMLVCEMAEFMNPEKVIIISSAKNSLELPKRYRFQKKFPIYKLVGPRLARGGAKFLQPIVEPDRNHQKAVFKSMLSDKDPLFLKRSIEMIIEWDRTTNSKEIIHIHGDNDHTIPVKNVDYDYLVEDGSHMMTLTRGAEIDAILKEVFSKP